MKKENVSYELTLRQRAEELLKKKLPHLVLDISEDEALKLIYELEVHQIELEMQNEELIRAKEMAAELAIEKYTELFDFAPLGYFILSKQGIIIDINLYGSEMLGKERSNLKNVLFETFISKDTRPIFNAFLKGVFNNNTKETCEITLVTNIDRVFDVHLTGILNANGDRCFMSGIDITERRRIERLHRESESFLKETQLIAQLGTYTMDIPSGNWVSSEVLDQVFGIGSDYDKSVEGWASIVHPDWQ
ncbi:MAG TPA: PAS domain-containing protein, partial [Prolixibacteraceae bacterium]